MQLRQAWNHDARADPPSDDDDDERSRHQHNGVNGDAGYHEGDGQRNGNGHYGGQGEDQEMGDAESDEEDMMDKISSSPSIDDGVYPSSPPFSVSEEAPAPGASTPQNSRQRPSTAPSPALSVGLSPFVNSPQHLPLGVGFGVSAAQQTPDSLCSSPFVNTPVHFPMSNPSALCRNMSTGHHDGEYVEAAKNHGDSTSADDVPRLGGTSSITAAMSQIDALVAPQPLERDMSVASLNDEAMGKLLLPADDPLLGQEMEYGQEQGTHVIADATVINADEDGWETESNTSFNSLDYNNDDPDDVSYSAAKDPRFVDSGWGGECLQETEDIDFEFVYALHTFVATVEGQADATKGDTMVLLDDSNSYWWLVRIVKDSSIGTARGRLSLESHLTAQATFRRSILRRRPSD